MKIFELCPDDSYNYEIDATHRWGLPGVTCDVCGATWSNTGTCYPTADLSMLPNAERYTDLRPVSLLELEELRAVIIPLLPPGALAPPGTDLGALVGQAKGAIPDLAWQHSWTLLVRKNVFDALAGVGVVRLSGAAAQLGERGTVPPLIELEARQHGRLAPVCLPPGGFPRCEACGRVAVKRPERVLLDKDSLRNAPDVFRLGDLTTMIAASERFVEAMKALGLKGARFEEVPLA